MQDLLDLQPLEPKKTAATTTATSDTPIPAPNLKDLESVKTGASSKDGNMLDPTKTGASLVPLDPFKTGGHNILPMSTGGFVVMPMATGGLIPLQRTGGVVVPQTTFGIQPTGGILPVQKTSGGLIPASTTGGLLPQTTFGMQPTGGLMMPLPVSYTHLDVYKRQGYIGISFIKKKKKRVNSQVTYSGILHSILAPDRCNSLSLCVCS